MHAAKTALGRFAVMLLLGILGPALAAPMPGGNPLVGTWILTGVLEGDLPSTYLLHIAAQPDGSLGGAIDDYADLQQVRLDRRAVALETDGFVFTGSFGADDDTIDGMLKPHGFVNRMMGRFFGQKPAIPVTLRRVDPAALPLRPQSRDYVIDGHRVHYEEVAATSAARVLFIHGSPGEWNDWMPYLTNADLQQRATLIAVDRPGWGASEPGQVISDLRQQAHLLAPLLQPAPATDAAKQHVPTVVVGWSNGGPIAAEMAMDDAADVQGAILIAPAIDPAYGGAQWYNRAVAFWPIGKLVSWLMGPAMLWSNREIMPLAAQLKAMEPRWQSLTVPTIVIQGEDDGLVDPRTADFAARELPAGDRVIRVPGAGHGVVFTKTSLAALNGMLDRIAESHLAAAARGGH